MWGYLFYTGADCTGDTKTAQSDEWGFGCNVFAERTHCGGQFNSRDDPLICSTGGVLITYDYDFDPVCLPSPYNTIAGVLTCVEFYGSDESQSNAPSKAPTKMDTPSPVTDTDCSICPGLPCCDIDPTTANPSQSPTTASPTDVSQSPTTAEPTDPPTEIPTAVPTTFEPTTVEPTTNEPTTSEPTMIPKTSEPTTRRTKEPTNPPTTSSLIGDTESMESTNNPSKGIIHEISMISIVLLLCIIIVVI